MKYRRFVSIATLLIAAALCAQEPAQNRPDQPPRSDVESSSNDTKIDTSPPSNDAKEHPNSDAGDVGEFHAWNPHKAQKDIEVGDYYFKRENYSAAASRYQEALLFKPSDADATFKLAQTLEKLKKYDDARDNYQAYLKIISSGKAADEARRALERLPKEQNISSNK